ncbi:MAG: hypothetical protein EOO20_16255 [Chryseobacterium sp.]|nr:MAG: hypothetical protein EOO20_16255 [Chryseobacterium sp.]
MEWVYDNQQKEKEIFNAKGIGICSQSIIRKVGNNDKIKCASVYVDNITPKLNRTGFCTT